jgi:hypothetical protein
MEKSTITSIEPTPDQLTNWWKWALSFPQGPDSPFDKSIGERFHEVSRQELEIYCLACTAGKGNTGKVVRPTLDYAINSGKDIFVPILVTAVENLADLDAQHPENLTGGPIFKINGNPANVFDIDLKIDVPVTQNNEFDINNGTNRTLHTRNKCALIKRDDASKLESIEFGGKLGQVSVTDTDTFVTLVEFK